MRITRGLVEEEILHDHAFHRLEAAGDVQRVGIGLGDVLALHIETLERTFHGLVHHVGNAQAGRLAERSAPQLLEGLMRRVVRHMPIAGKFVRERPHVAGALNVVLTAQRVHADAFPADVARRHRQIGDRHHGGRTLRMFGHAQPVVDRAVSARGVEARRRANVRSGHAGGGFNRLGRMTLGGDETSPLLEVGPVAASAHIVLLHEAFRHDDMGQRGEYGDIRARTQRQVMIGLDMRGAHEIDLARIDDDQLGALAKTLLHTGGEDRMRVGRIGADHYDHVGFLNRFEVLRACRRAEGLAEAIACRRMADAGAGVDVVVAEAGAHQLLHQPDFLVGAARGGDGADGIATIFGLYAPEFGGGVFDRLIP